MTDTSPDPTPGELTVPLKQELLRLAREALYNRLSHSSSCFAEAADVSAELHRVSGAFVSLHVEEDLYGCIGSIYPEKPLFLTVQEMAIQAAMGDPRFPDLKGSDLPHTDIEVSILSALTPIRAGDVKVGTHGLLLAKGSRRGLLLPQVPVQYGWKRGEFLTQLCLKAGLPDNAWRTKDAQLLAFTAEVFSDSSLEEAEYF